MHELQRRLVGRARVAPVTGPRFERLKGISDQFDRWKLSVSPDRKRIGEFAERATPRAGLCVCMPDSFVFVKPSAGRSLGSQCAIVMAALADEERLERRAAPVRLLRPPGRAVQPGAAVRRSHGEPGARDTHPGSDRKSGGVR